MKIKNSTVLAISFLLTYLLADTVYSCLYVDGVLYKDVTWFSEELDDGVSFCHDSQYGYRISSDPARYGVVVSDGRLATMGSLVGNNLGFPDQKDFHPTSKDSSVFRIAIFGDSFSSSQFVSKNWVILMEENLNKDLMDSIELLNFSIDGGGLGNWASIVENEMIENEWELDGVVFAVSSDDLNRKFHWRHVVQDGGSQAVYLGYCDAWGQSTGSEFHSQFADRQSFGWSIFSSEVIDGIERGRWENSRSFKPYLFLKILEIVSELWNSCIGTANATSPEGFVQNHLSLVENLKKHLEAIGAPVLVFSFENGDGQRPLLFSDIISSDFIKDKEDPFFENRTVRGYRLDEVYRIEGDGHWNQRGTQAFVNRNYTQFKNWVSSNVLNSTD